MNDSLGVLGEISSASTKSLAAALLTFTLGGKLLSRCVQVYEGLTFAAFSPEAS